MGNSWTDFEGRLGRYLALMDDDDHLIVEIPELPDDAQARPYAQICVDGGLFAEVPGNAVLLPAHQLTPAALARLGVDGWQPADDDTPNLWRHETDPTEVARAVVEALAEEYGVAHPSLLSARAWGGPAARRLRSLGLTAAATELVPVVTSEPEVTVVVPRDRDHLIAAVESALAAVPGVEPARDPDGDFVVMDSGMKMWVRVRLDAPVVTVFSIAVRKVRSRRQAALELATLNTPRTVGRYVLAGSDVVLMADVPARPFVPEHLVRLLRAVRVQGQRDCGGLTLRLEGAR